MRDESGIMALMKDLSCLPSEYQFNYVLGRGASSRTPEVEVTKEISTVCVSMPKKSTGNFGVALLTKSIENGKMLSLWRNLIYLHYKGLLQNGTETVHRHLANVPYQLHIAKDAFFLWLWLPSLPVSSLALYRRLNQRSIIVVLGNFFFFGLDENWLHRDECIRINYAQRLEIFNKGIETISDEVRHSHQDSQPKVVVNA